MLTQVELAAATGLGLTQLRKYLKHTLEYLSKNRCKILADDEVIIQEVNGKPLYNQIVLQEIQVRIDHVRNTRYARSARSRRRNRGDSDNRQKSA